MYECICRILAHAMISPLLYPAAGACVDSDMAYVQTRNCHNFSCIVWTQHLFASVTLPICLVLTAQACFSSIPWTNRQSR